MAYSAVAVANAFIQRAMEGRIPELSPMKLQKLMFYAQSWNLRLYNTPLIDDFFAKWQHGPVIPSLYHELKMYGSWNISNKIKTLIIDNFGQQQVAEPMIPIYDMDSHNLIDKIINTYGVLSAYQLSNLTHQPNTAWSKTEIDGGVISNEYLMRWIS